MAKINIKGIVGKTISDIGVYHTPDCENIDIHLTFTDNTSYCFSVKYQPSVVGILYTSPSDDDKEKRTKLFKANHS